MLTTKIVGTLIILLLIVALYFLRIKKEDRKNHRYIIPTATGFALAVLPQTFIHKDSILTAISVVATALVLIGMYWYAQQRKKEKKEYKMKKAEEKSAIKKHR